MDTQTKDTLSAIQAGIYAGIWTIERGLHKAFTLGVLAGEVTGLGLAVEISAIDAALDKEDGPK